MSWLEKILLLILRPHSLSLFEQWSYLNSKKTSKILFLQTNVKQKFRIKDTNYELNMMGSKVAIHRKFS